MIARSFSLVPFSASGLAGECGLAGQLVRCGEMLSISFELTGPLKKVAIPAGVAAPARGHGLWQETCFEVFGRAAGRAAYWEVNLSPAGHWNVFTFDDYRQGMQEAVASLSPLVRSQAENSLTLGLELGLGGLPGGDQPLEVAVAAVLFPSSPGPGPVYWALGHPAPQPDFHHPAGFLLQL